MYPQIINVASAFNPNVNTLTFDTSSFVYQDGDILIAALRGQNASSTSDWSSSGFTRVGPPFLSANASQRVTGFFRKVITTASTGPTSVVFSGQTGTGQRNAGNLFLIRGYAGYPVDVDTYFNSNIGVTETLGRTISPYATTKGSLLVLVLGANEITSPNQTNPTSTPSGYTQRAYTTTSTNTSISRTVCGVWSVEVASGNTPSATIRWQFVSASVGMSIALYAPVPPVSVKNTTVTINNTIQIDPSISKTTSTSAGIAIEVETNDQAAKTGYSSANFETQLSIDPSISKTTSTSAGIAVEVETNDQAAKTGYSSANFETQLSVDATETRIDISPSTFTMKWDNVDPTYEFGVDHGALYPTRNSKVAWDGLLSVTETPVLNDADPVYFEGKKLNIPSKPSDFSAAVSAFTYPEELEDTKDIYAMSFRTYKEGEKVSLHIIYNPVFTPDSIDYESFGSGIDPIKFSWSVINRSSYLKNYAPSGHFIIEFYNVPKNFVSDIEDILYDTASTFPTPQELVDIFEELSLHNTLLIVDHGNGMWTAIGPDDMINIVDETSFEITSPTAIFGGEYWYTIESF